VELIPENPEFETIHVPSDANDFSLEGLAVGLIRNTMLT
jgi:repressor LexA